MYWIKVRTRRPLMLWNRDSSVTARVIVLRLLLFLLLTISPPANIACPACAKLELNLRSIGGLHCSGSGGVGLAAAHRLPLTATSLSRLSVPTSRCVVCDLGSVGGSSGSLFLSGGGPRIIPRASPCGLGSPWLRLGCGFLSWLLSLLASSRLFRGGK